MILNYSLLGKLTDRGKSVDQEETSNITKNRSSIVKKTRLLTKREHKLTRTIGFNPLFEDFMRYDIPKIPDEYLSAIASTGMESRLEHSMLTRATYYNFVEK